MPTRKHIALNNQLSEKVELLANAQNKRIGTLVNELVETALGNSVGEAITPEKVKRLFPAYSDKELLELAGACVITVSQRKNSKEELTMEFFLGLIKGEVTDSEIVRFCAEFNLPVNLQGEIHEVLKQRKNKNGDKRNRIT